MTSCKLIKTKLEDITLKPKITLTLEMDFENLNGVKNVIEWLKKGHVEINEGSQLLNNLAEIIKKETNYQN